MLRLLRYFGHSGTPLVFLVLLVVFLIPWAVPLKLVFSTNQAFGLGCGAVILGFILFGVGYQKKLYRWQKILASLYWPTLLILQAPFILFGRLVNVPYFWLCVAVSTLAVIPKFGNQSKNYIPFAAVGIMSIAVSHACYLYAPWTGGVVLLAGIAATTFTYWLSRKKIFATVSGLAISFFAFSIMIYSLSLFTYTLITPNQFNKVVSQKGVHEVFSYSDPELKGKMSPQLMYMGRVPGTKTFLMGPNNPSHDLHVLTTKPTPHVDLVPIQGRGGDNMIFDPDNPDIAYIPGRDALFRYSISQKMITAVVDLEFSKMPIGMFRLDKANNRFFIARSDHPRIDIVDRRTFQHTGSIFAPDGSVFNDVWIDEKTNRFITLGTYMFGFRIDSYNRSTLKHLDSQTLPWKMTFFGTMDPEGRKIYIATIFSGEIYVFDLDTFRFDDSFFIETGLRNVSYDPSRRCILICSYFQGNLIVYDAVKKQTIGSLFIGKRSRWVTVDSENGNWYVTGAAGGFEINPEEAFPNHFYKPLRSALPQVNQ